ncbi:MAG: HD domain-containing protein [Acidobacteriaceae bacterium]
MTSFQQAVIVNPFDEHFAFQDDVHGAITLSTLERDVIDTPEFQRLFRISQLGFIDLVYPTANHTRGVHSIGSCHVAKNLINRANANTRLFKKTTNSRYSLPSITRSERIIISLGALLHDITHGPFSHEIEKKSHLLPRPNEDPIKIQSHYGPYPKHDDYINNPVLYVLLFDEALSVLARVLRSYSKQFYELMIDEVTKAPSTDGSTSHIGQFVQAVEGASWDRVKDELLPQLLFHLLTFEKPDEASDRYSFKLRKSFNTSDHVTEWGLGPSPHGNHFIMLGTSPIVTTSLAIP